jgi:hypothetical protein
MENGFENWTPHDILNRLSRWRQLITDDEDFISYLQSARMDHEAYMAEKKLIGSTGDSKS